MNEATIARVVGWGKTLGCIASSITVNLPEPGHIHRGAAMKQQCGPMRPMTPMPDELG